MSASLLGLAENPFSEGHDARFLYPSHAYWSVVTRLRGAVEKREPFVYLTGPAGCGKTTALHEFLAGLESHTAVTIAATPSLTLDEFGAQVRSALGFGPADRIEAILRDLHARGEVVVLVVDESQNLCPELFEELMALGDLEAGGERLAQIVMAGQPVLEKLLSRPGCEALRPRVATRCWMGALSAEETEGYIRHRVSVVSGASRPLFSSESCRAIHRFTQGIPRDINRLASETLLQAAASGASAVAPGHVAAAARVIGLVRPEAAAWVARFGRPCVTPGIESRIGAAMLFSEMIETAEEERRFLPIPKRRSGLAGRAWRALPWLAGALLLFAVGFLLARVGRSPASGPTAYPTLTTSSTPAVTAAPTSRLSPARRSTEVRHAGRPRRSATGTRHAVVAAMPHDTTSAVPGDSTRR